MSVPVARAMSKARDVLPPSAEVSSVGATIYVRNVSKEQMELLDGQEVDRLEFDLVQQFSDEKKGVYNLVNKSRQMVV